MRREEVSELYTSGMDVDDIAMLLELPNKVIVNDLIVKGDLKP